MTSLEIIKETIINLTKPLFESYVLYKCTILEKMPVNRRHGSEIRMILLARKIIPNSRNGTKITPD